MNVRECCAEGKHEHEHGCCGEEGEEKETLLLPRLIIALILLGAALYTKRLPLYIAAYAVSGADVVIAAVKGLFKGKVFNESFLMTLATVGAFIIGDYAEGVAVMIFYGFGEYIQDKAVDKSNDSINELISLRPDRARLVEDDGEKIVAPAEVKVGDIISVLPGERVPLDGVLISGSATADTSAITGESLPRDYSEGEEICSGVIALRSAIQLRVTKKLEDSSTERIFRMVTEARENKSSGERFITRFAVVYTPVIVFAALILAFVPPIFVGHLASWIHRGLIFLVASCPCALVLSVPLTYFAGIGLASRSGVLFKGSVFMERLAGVDTVAFDKTGTLTRGELSLVDFDGEDREELFRLAACAERGSEHPIGRAISPLYSGEAEITDFEELVGGVSATVDGVKVVAGNTALTGIRSNSPNTAVHVLKDGKYIGSLYLADTLRPESPDAASELAKMGIKTALITGDSTPAAEAAAKELGITEVHSSVLPDEKLNIIKGLAGKTAFVGDGINDSPALSGADVGIAMGGMGREAAMEAADVVIMDDSPAKVPLAVKIARKTLNTAVIVVAFALLVKLAVLVLGACGLANMWLAVFADVGVALIAVVIAVLMCRKV